MKNFALYYILHILRQTSFTLVWHWKWKEEIKFVGGRSILAKINFNLH